MRYSGHLEQQQRLPCQIYIWGVIILFFFFPLNFPEKVFYKSFFPLDMPAICPKQVYVFSWLTPYL